MAQSIVPNGVSGTAANVYSHAASLKESFDTQLTQERHARMLGKHASVPIKKAVKVETVKELRKKLKDREKLEQAQAAVRKRQRAEDKARAKRYKIALDALALVAKHGDDASAVEAAKVLLNS